MKQNCKLAVSLFLTLLVIAISFEVTTTQAASGISTARNQHVNPNIQKVPSKPISGIAEGIVVAISTTSITIKETIHIGRTTSVTQKTFVLMNGVKINKSHKKGSSNTIAVGSSVSLTLGHIGNSAGKVIEIRQNTILSKKVYFLPQSFFFPGSFTFVFACLHCFFYKFVSIRRSPGRYRTCCPLDHG